MSEWRPIETAPREKPVIVFDPRGGRGWNIEVGIYDLYGLFWFDLGGDHRLKPTHWMPLPEPPEVIDEA